MSITRSRLAGGVVSLTALAGSLLAPVPPAQAATVELHATMRPTAAQPRAHGSAEYEAEHGTREFEIRLAGLRGLAGRRLTVRVHGDVVGRMRVTRYGRAHLERHRGVFRMRAGNAVRVRTAKGTLVSRGILRHDADHD